MTNYRTKNYCSGDLTPGLANRNCYAGGIPALNDSGWTQEVQTFLECYPQFLPGLYELHQSGVFVSKNSASLCHLRRGSLALFVKMKMLERVDAGFRDFAVHAYVSGPQVGNIGHRNGPHST